MSNALSGHQGSVMIGANSVADIDQWDVDLEIDTHDVTNFESDGNKEYISGCKGWSGSFSGNWAVADDTNGQAALQSALLAGTSVSLKLYVDATHYYSGSALLSNMSVGTPVQDKVTVSFSFQGTGAITYN